MSQDNTPPRESGIGAMFQHLEQCGGSQGRSVSPPGAGTPKISAEEHERSCREQARDRLREKIRARFTYYPPSAEQIPFFGSIRDGAKELGLVMASVCPESRELSLALTHLEDAVMWANAAIARDGKGA